MTTKRASWPRILACLILAVIANIVMQIVMWLLGIQLPNFIGGLVFGVAEGIVFTAIAIWLIGGIHE